VAAYVTLPVPRGAAEAAEAAEDEAAGRAEAEETEGKEGEAGVAEARSSAAGASASAGAVATEGSAEGSGGPFYPAPIAALLATPDCADALQVQTLLLSRWHITADMTRKASAMMARAALAVTRAQADDEGLHIDLGLLEGQRSSLEAAQAANAAAKADARQRRAAAAAAGAAAGAGEGAGAAGMGESASSAAAADGSSAAGLPGAAQAQQQHQVVNKSLVKAQVRALLAKQHTAAAPAPAGGSGSSSAGAGSSDGAAGGSAAGKKGGKGGHGPQFVHPSVHPIVLFASYDDGRPDATNAAAAAVLAYEQQLLRSWPQWNPADAANELYRNPYGRGLGGGFGHDASSAGGAAGVAGAADAGRRAASCAGSLTALPPDADATLLRLHAEATRAIDAAAAQPASAAYQALLEAARRRLVSGADSLAGPPLGDSAAAAAAAGSAALPEVRSRGWYLHSREWTKLRAS